MTEKTRLDIQNLRTLPCGCRIVSYQGNVKDLEETCLACTHVRIAKLHQRIATIHLERDGSPTLREQMMEDRERKRREDPRL